MLDYYYLHDDGFVLYQELCLWSLDSWHDCAGGRRLFKDELIRWVNEIVTMIELTGIDWVKAKHATQFGSEIRLDNHILLSSFLCRFLCVFDLSMFSSCFGGLQINFVVILLWFVLFPWKHALCFGFCPFVSHFYPQFAVPLASGLCYAMKRM